MTVGEDAAASTAAAATAQQAAYTPQEVGAHVREEIGKEVEKINEEMKPLKAQIEVLLKAMEAATNREKAQELRIQKMEAEKAKQEDTIGAIKKKLRIKAIDDSLSTSDEEDDGERAAADPTSAAANGETTKKIKDIKGFDHKTAPKPDKYGGDVKEFHVWQDLFTVTMSALDPQWSMILKEIEGKEEEIIRKEHEEDMRKSWGITSEPIGRNRGEDDAVENGHQIYHRTWHGA